MKKFKKIKFALITLVFLITITFILSVNAQEESPQLPHLFYGTSKINGQDTPIGTVIIAKVNGEEKGRITTTEIGKYGGSTADENKLLVQGDIADNAQIRFYINNISANEVTNFDSGEIEERNLTWTFPDLIEYNDEVANEPYTCIPGTDIEVNLNGLTITIECDTASAGTINDISIIDTPTSGAISIFPASTISTFYEISILGDADIIATIPYDDTGIDESTVRPYKFVGGVWTPLPESDIISRDTTANKITFKISPGGTPYTIFGSAPAPVAVGGAVTGAGGGGAALPTPTPSPTPTPTPTPPTPAPTAPTEPTPEAGAPTAPPAPTGLAAITGAVIGALQTTTGKGILVALAIVVLGLGAWYYIFKKK